MSAVQIPAKPTTQKVAQAVTLMLRFMPRSFVSLGHLDARTSTHIHTQGERQTERERERERPTR